MYEKLGLFKRFKINFLEFEIGISNESKWWCALKGFTYMVK
jgi:hypothetical protein